MSTIRLIQGSAVLQPADAVVNAANRYLAAGGGICGAIFAAAGHEALRQACAQYTTPLRDGDAVITPAFGIKNAKYIIHAVGPDFGITPHAFEALNDAYFHALEVLRQNELHSIAFPLISSGIFGGSLENPVAVSAKECKKAYEKFIAQHPDYEVDVTLCAYSLYDYQNALAVFEA